MTYLEKTDGFIRSLGLESYRVGGSVRDEILSRRVKDADYMIRAELSTIESAIRSSDQFKKNKSNLSKLQLRDGTHVGWRVSIKGLGLIEICLPRTDVSTGPGRQDFEIQADPSVSIEDDAVRRDFTFNALYVKVDSTGNEIIDPLGGLEDLNNKTIRTTDPDSFRDDPLRMLRAIRFVSTLGFYPDDSTLGQMVRHHKSIDGLTQKGVSGTAWQELQKILMGFNVDNALRLARDTGILATFLPELAPMLGFDQESKWHDMTVDEHTFSALYAAHALEFPLRVRVALLFHDSGKPEVAWRGNDGRLHYYEHSDIPGSENHELASARRAEKALRRLNVEKSMLHDVIKLVTLHMVNASGKTKPSKIRRLRADIGDDLLRDLIRHATADALGKSETISNDSLIALSRMETIRAEAQAQKIPASVQDLKDQGLITGKDIMDMGAKGKSIGAVLEQLLHEVVSQPKLADRDWLLGRAEKLVKKVNR